MKIADQVEAWEHLESWYVAHRTAEEQPLSVVPMRSMNGHGGWVFRVDFDESLALVRVGPRGGLDWIITLTNEQIQELQSWR